MASKCEQPISIEQPPTWPKEKLNPWINPEKLPLEYCNDKEQIQQCCKKETKKLLCETEKCLNIKKLKETLKWKSIPPTNVLEFSILNKWEMKKCEIKYEKWWFYYNWEKIKYPISNISFKNETILVNMRIFPDQEYSYNEFYDKVIES